MPNDWRSLPRGPKTRKSDEREALFLSYYYGDKSPTKGKMADSMLEAGYPQTTALTQGPRILEKYKDGAFAVAARVCGITKPFLAMKMKQILDLPIKDHSKEVMAAIRLTLANFGEATDQSTGGGNTFNAPVMMIVGATPERIEALRNSTPQLSREQLEQISNERSAKKLQMLKDGLMPPLLRRIENDRPLGRPSHVQKDPLDEPNIPETETNLPDSPGPGLNGGNQETEPIEG